jgi:arylsulfatase A-like enzyme
MSERRPNILFIMSDDHAAHAISAYGSRLNHTPHLDRLAAEGARLDNCHCTNALCTPSRATIVTGQYGHRTGVTCWQPLDNRRPVQLQKLLRAAGYATALFGKWHLDLPYAGHGIPGPIPGEPAGFDDWATLNAQGTYFDPVFRTPRGEIQVTGYTTDVITDLALDWLCRQRPPARPFYLCVHHKAPHSPWTPAPRHNELFADRDLPLPATFDDDYATRPAAAAAAIRIPDHVEMPGDEPPGLSPAQRKHWWYQHFIKNYLRTVAGIDESVGRLLAYLDETGQAENTLVIYTSDQGYFLGDHGWADKRFIYEPSLRMPFLMRYPAEIPAGTVRSEILTNLDFAPTLLDYAGVEIPVEMQGRSGRALLRGAPPADWPDSFYYRYWDHGGRGVCAHYGVRTMTHKLVYYHPQPVTWAGKRDVAPQLTPYWELFDLVSDPHELRNRYGDPALAPVQAALHAELDRLQAKYEDAPLHSAPTVTS